MDGTWYRWEDERLILHVRLQPRASKNEIAGPHGAHLRIRLTSPPVEGRANAQLVAFLADVFGVPRARVTLLSGDTSREKRLAIDAPEKLIEGITR